MVSIDVDLNIAEYMIETPLWKWKMNALDVQELCVQEGTFVHIDDGFESFTIFAEDVGCINTLQLGVTSEETSALIFYCWGMLAMETIAKILLS